LRVLSRRHKELETVVGKMHELKSAQDDVAIARELAADAVGAERELGRDEQNVAEARVVELETECAISSCPRPPRGRNVIVEIGEPRAGRRRTCSRRTSSTCTSVTADRRGWRPRCWTFASRSSAASAGSRSCQGDDAWQRLHQEAGTHRVQRIPLPSPRSRPHVSATVNVLPEADEVEVEIEPETSVSTSTDNRPWGTSVNTTDSAVRITHLPSGLVVAMQDEKSQIQTAAALKVLRARLYELERQRNAAALAQERRAQVGGGAVRRRFALQFQGEPVTDHRIGLT